MSVQYNTRKQLVLKTLYSYISHEKGLYDVDAFSMFGTNSFNLVWEKVCSDILNNQLRTPIGLLPIPGTLHSDFQGVINQPLISLIDKPIWIGSGFCHIANDTLIPDLISIERVGTNLAFIIFDAKYYTPQLEPDKPLRAQPGIESVTKQYLYQLAFQPFVKKNGFERVVNCFIMPTTDNEPIDKGTVSMPMLDNLGLERIKVRLLPAAAAYEHYMAGTKYDITRLRF